MLEFIKDNWYYIIASLIAIITLIYTIRRNRIKDRESRDKEFRDNIVRRNNIKPSFTYVNTSFSPQRRFHITLRNTGSGAARNIQINNVQQPNIFSLDNIAPNMQRGINEDLTISGSGPDNNTVRNNLIRFTLRFEDIDRNLYQQEIRINADNQVIPATLVR